MGFNSGFKGLSLLTSQEFLHIFIAVCFTTVFTTARHQIACQDRWPRAFLADSAPNVGGS